MKRLYANVTLAALVAWSVSGLGAVYKWVDENGKVHYSDKPHASATEMDIKSDPSSGTPTPSDAQRRAKRKRLLEAFEKEREEKATEQAEAKQDKAKRAAQCANLRKELQEIEQASYLYDYDESDEIIVYSHEQRAQATKAYRDKIKKHC